MHQLVGEHGTGTGPRPIALLRATAKQREPSHIMLGKHMNNLAYSGKQDPTAQRAPCSALSAAAASLMLCTQRRAGHGTAGIRQSCPHPTVPCTPTAQLDPQQALGVNPEAAVHRYTGLYPQQCLEWGGRPTGVPRAPVALSHPISAEHLHPAPKEPASYPTSCKERKQQRELHIITTAESTTGRVLEPKHGHREVCGFGRGAGC